MQDTNEELSPTSLYGGQHLLRLLVKLPDLLPAYGITAGNYAKLQHAMSEFVVYLQDNAAQLLPATADRL